MGIGSALTRESIQWAQEANASEISAHTHPWNIKSQNNLKKAGFEYHGTLPDKWKPTGVILESRDIKQATARVVEWHTDDTDSGGYLRIFVYRL